MPEGEKEHVINILTAILILGQIQFKTQADGVGVRITNPAVVKVSTGEGWLLVFLSEQCSVLLLIIF